ncbi:hypothetical protein, partial [Pontibacterium sp.]|uniref:hypothetical protein n=2 Tax=Pontibacterium sp. TaxID=2036026 RepID=UPI0035597ACE
MLSIMLVGGGGLWGAATISRGLDQVTNESLPTVSGSLNQMITLQQANLALLTVLSDDKDKKLRTEQKKGFEEQVQVFQSRLEDLGSQYDLTDEQRTQLQTASETEASFTKAALNAMTLHEQQLMLAERVRQKESGFQRKMDTLNTWSQKYISKNTISERLTRIRAFMRAANAHRTQLINFRQSQD